MKVLDGRNPNKVPEVIELSEFLIRSKYFCHFYAGAYHYVYDLQLDGEHVVCVSTAERDYKYILCASYKTERGFEQWLKRMCEHANKLNW